MRLVVAMLALMLGGCAFGGVVLRNVPWFFRTPAAAPRSDAPRSDDAALSVIWIGHATCLIQIGDRYVLTDPVFTELVGGFSRRLVAASLPPSALPQDLTVVVSHRHFDHLSRDSFPLIADHVRSVLTPQGARDDVPAAGYEVNELAWWQSWQDRGLRITAVPAAHEGNRLLHDEAAHPFAFGGYVIEYKGRSVYFAGDTAYEPQLFAQIAARFTRLDLALLPIGPMAPEHMMLSHHMNPEQAIAAFVSLRAAQLIPIHFATYLHSYDAPGDCEARFDAAASKDAQLRSRARRLLIGERRIVVPISLAAFAGAP